MYTVAHKINEGSIVIIITIFNKDATFAHIASFSAPFPTALPVIRNAKRKYFSVSVSTQGVVCGPSSLSMLGNFNAESQSRPKLNTFYQDLRVILTLEKQGFDSTSTNNT